MNAVCFSFAQDALFGRRLAAALGAEHQEVDLHRFPDGETRVQLQSHCANRSVLFVCGGRDPNTTALPLLFAVHAARAMGATKVGLVAPYLAYMRQDTQFHDGEAVSAAAYGRLLSQAFDWIATVDPHLHRMKSLDAVFSIPALCISSMPAVADWITANVADPVLIGPDDESTQWAKDVAQRLGVPWSILHKVRTGDRQVSISLPDPEILRGRSAVIVDDIASSGRTLAEAVSGLASLDCQAVTCIVVHALLAPDAESMLEAAGAARLVSTNTVAHVTNTIDVVPLVAERILLLAAS